MLPSRRHAVTTLAPETANPPPSIGQALMRHVPAPSFRGSEKATPSREAARYMSREPSRELRHITSSWPAAPIATEGWQHSQMEPPGDWYTATFFDHVAPPSVERAAKSLVPLAPRLS